MKRRTRLLKQGLPADPKPSVLKSKPPSPNYYELALKLHAEIVRTNVFTPATLYPLDYTEDLEVLGDCHRYGVPQTVECLRKLGVSVSELRRRLACR